LWSNLRMKTTSIIFLVWLSFSKVYAFDNPFVSFGGSYKKSTKDTIEITNMPPVRSQDSVGICFSFVASNLLDHQNCTQRKTDCRNIKDAERVSPLDLAKFTVDPPVSQLYSSSSASYKKLKEGGTAYNTLANAIYDAHSVASEACAPFQAAVNKYGDSDELQLKTWQMLREKFDKVHDKKTNCVDCIVDEVRNYFPSLQNKKAIKEALNQTNYEEFLYKLVVPDYCKQNSNQVKLNEDLTVAAYPDEDQKTATAQQMKDKMIEVLKKGKPLSLTGICMDRKDVIPDLTSCETYHAVTITGFTKMCNSKGVCHEAFKVQNSWGEEWQKKNSDGWVLASQLTERVGGVFGAINWLE